MAVATFRTECELDGKNVTVLMSELELKIVSSHMIEDILGDLWVFRIEGLERKKMTPKTAKMYANTLRRTVMKTMA